MKHSPHTTWAHGTRSCSSLPVFVFLFLAAALQWRAIGAELISRETVLRTVATGVIAAGYQDLAARCRDLTNAAGILAHKPEQTTLDCARKAWAAAMAASCRMRCFQSGPIVDREYAVTFYYARVSPQSVDNAVGTSNVISQACIDAQGGDVKGMFALEYLLFGRAGDPAADATNAAVQLLSGKNSEPRREYLLAAAMDVERRASQLAQDWTEPGAQGAAAKFVAGGQASINLLVNDVAHACEDDGATRLNLPLVLPNPISRQLYRIEGSSSGTSLENLVADLEGTRRLYAGAGGPGLADVLKDLNAPLAARVEANFDSAIAAATAIGEPLEKALVDRRAAVQTALDKTRALEISCKADLASALGVTITFTSGDGD